MDHISASRKTGLRPSAATSVRLGSSTSSPPRDAKVASNGGDSAQEPAPEDVKGSHSVQSSKPQEASKPKLRSPTDASSEYQRKLEERFGGGESAAIGQLVDGKPEGLASNVKRNMFRLI
ncbi:hypothetical protein JCM8202v2_004419 [Rhodotorula sphaerocarpa]